MKVGVYEEKFPTWKSPVTDNGYRGPGVAPERASGWPKGQTAAILAPEFGKRNPPAHCYLDAFRHTGLTLGTVYTMSRYTMTT